jgi:hypothetical protein
MDLTRTSETVPTKQTTTGFRHGGTATLSTIPTGTHSTCPYARFRIAELALGVLDDPPSSKVLKHIDDCSDCGVEFAALVVVAGRLAELAPDQEPPIGFETWTASRISRLSSRIDEGSRAGRVRL